ncbi:hypothetical protein Tco_0919871 [Tanacetum coccineum]
MGESTYYGVIATVSTQSRGRVICAEKIMVPPNHAEHYLSPDTRNCGIGGIVGVVVGDEGEGGGRKGLYNGGGVVVGLWKVAESAVDLDKALQKSKVAATLKSNS